jgi:hypothetical protein
MLPQLRVESHAQPGNDERFIFRENSIVGGLRQFVTLEIERATGSKIELLFRKADGELFVNTVEDVVNVGNRD